MTNVAEPQMIVSRENEVTGEREQECQRNLCRGQGVQVDPQIAQGYLPQFPMQYPKGERKKTDR